MASTTLSRQQLISLYRALLRELPPLRPATHIAHSTPATTPIPGPPPTTRLPVHHHLRATFSGSSGAASNNWQNRIPTHDQAWTLVEYLRNQRVYIELLERYNPMLRMEDKERIRLTARRVGLDLPVEFVNTKGVK